MNLRLIENPDAGRGIAYSVARVVYAETSGASLRVVEALMSMIKNNAHKNNRDISDVISDHDLFRVLCPENVRHDALYIPADNRRFQMCVRVATRMLRGGLADTTHGATVFHHADEMPAWATARGYVADIDGILFYK